MRVPAYLTGLLTVSLPVILVGCQAAESPGGSAASESTESPSGLPAPSSEGSREPVDLAALGASEGASNPSPSRRSGQNAGRGTNRHSVPTDASSRGAGEQAGDVVAYINGRAVSPGDLRRGLYEAAGGQVFAELLLETRVRSALAEQNLHVTQAMVEAEHERFLAGLNDDRAVADQLAERVRQEEGRTRYERRLRINAGLRRLVASEVAISDAAVRQAFEVAHGEKFQPRLIVVGELGKANELRQRATSGDATFTELAIEHSQDVSRRQGGLLDPVSPYDSSYPKAIRDALSRLEVGQVSQPIALEQGFALLKLERKIEPDPVAYADVKDEFRRRVRLRLEQLRMQQEARALIESAKVTVLDETLQRAWQQHRAKLLNRR